MSTTYESVMETKERGMLVEKTGIYYEYLGALHLIYPQIIDKFNRRYIFVAEVDQNEESVTNNNLEHDIASFKRDIRKEVGELKKMMEESKKESQNEKTKICLKIDVNRLELKGMN